MRLDILLAKRSGFAVAQLCPRAITIKKVNFMKQPSSNYPEFMRMVDLVSNLNPFQSKRIKNFIDTQDIEFWEYAESLCNFLSNSLLKTDEERAASAKAYNQMTMDFLKEQIRFKKTGTYLLNDASLAIESVYDNPIVMRYYMVGLCLSYLLWPNHYKMLRFFKNYLKVSPEVNRYLDVAPGHGLFAAETMRRFPSIKASLLDISVTSIQVSGQILESFQIKPSRFDFINGDFLTVPIDGGEYDFISMGEVLEHVNDPLGFLKRARNLLKDDGRVFMTTCTNAPALDHIYHFHNTNEIRALIYEAGFCILSQESLPAEDVPEERCEEELVTINYCSILAKIK